MKKYRFIIQFLKHPFSIIKNGLKAGQETQFRNSINKKYKIEQLPTIDLLHLFPNFEERLCCYSFLDGTSLITDIMLLKQLAKTYPRCQYLEIGSWRGESIKNVSEIAEHCVSITLSPEEMKHMKINQELIDLHGIFSKNTKNITEILHNSQTFDFSKLENKFDLIFIDGDHTYKGVLNDTKKTLNLRKDTNSVIVWHDYGFSTEVVRHSVLAGILDGIPPEKHKNLFHVSNTMCAIYIEYKRFETYKTKFPTVPNKNFSVIMKAEKL